LTSKGGGGGRGKLRNWGRTPGKGSTQKKTGGEINLGGGENEEELFSSLTRQKKKSECFKIGIRGVPANTRHAESHSGKIEGLRCQESKNYVQEKEGEKNEGKKETGNWPNLSSV